MEVTRRGGPLELGNFSSRARILEFKVDGEDTGMRFPTKAGLSAVATVALVLSAHPTGQTLSLRTVNDLRHRFTISVPATWHVETSTGDPAVDARSPAPARGAPDTVDVIVRDMPMSLSPQGCVLEAKSVLRYVIHSYTTVSEGPDTIARRPAYTHAYTWRTKTGEERRSLQVCVTVGHRAFMLIGTTDNTPTRVHEATPLLTHIIETFRPAAQQPEPDLPGPGISNR